MLRDKSPPAPHRHAERGHPLPSNRSLEPKAAIPFRNPDLGVPSHRRNNEIQNPDSLLPSSSPDPVDLSIEVEAQAGPRSLSPTPFKQAESLASPKKRGLRTSYSSSYQQSGSANSVKQNSGFSRSSSPSRNLSSFRRSESVSSLTSYGYGPSMVSEKRDQRSKSPNPNVSGRQPGSESAQKSFRTLASTVGNIRTVTKSVASPYTELKANLRKAEPVSSHSTYNKSPSPLKWNQDLGSQSIHRKKETKITVNSSNKGKSRSPSPSRSGSQFFMCKTVEGRRSASPVRKGYGASSQEDKDLVSNSPIHKKTSSSPTRRGFETQSMQKYDSKMQSSTLRWKNDAPRQSSQHKAGYIRSSNSRSPSPSKRGIDTLDPSLSHQLDSNKYYKNGGGQTAKHQSVSNFSSETSRRGKSVSSTSTGSWRGSTLSLPSPTASRNSSPSRKRQEINPTGIRKSAHVSWSSSERGRGRFDQSPSPRNRSPSSQTSSRFSSQSSIDSFTSSASSGLNREEYAAMAHLPKVKSVLQRTGPNQAEGAGKGNSDEMSRYKPAR